MKRVLGVLLLSGVLGVITGYEAAKREELNKQVRKLDKDFLKASFRRKKR